MKIISPIHAGEHLQEFLEEYEITQYRLAKEVHVPATRINEIIKGLRGISTDTAIRLGRYFGNSPQFWINLQSAYDLATTQIEDIETIEPIRSVA